jgi:hypothetical protein
MKTIMDLAKERSDKYQKENPLTVDQIMNMSLVRYKTGLMERFVNEVLKEREEVA